MVEDLWVQNTIPPKKQWVARFEDSDDAGLKPPPRALFWWTKMPPVVDFNYLSLNWWVSRILGCHPTLSTSPNFGWNFPFVKKPSSRFVTLKAGHDCWPVLRALLVTWPKGQTQVVLVKLARDLTWPGPPKIHPARLTWKLRIHPWKRKFIFQTMNFRFFVNLQGCSFLEGKSRLVKCYDLAIGHIFIFPPGN